MIRSGQANGLGWALARARRWNEAEVELTRAAALEDAVPSLAVGGKVFGVVVVTHITGVYEDIERLLGHHFKRLEGRVDVVGAAA